MMRAGISTTLLAIAVMAPASSYADESGEPVLLVVHEQSTLSSLSLAELRRLFSQRGLLSPGGDRLIPLNLPVGHPLRVAIDRAVLDLEPTRVGRYWIDQKIRGNKGPPTVVASADLITRFVRSVPNVVGYVRGPLPPGLRALVVDGKLPHDPDYPVRSAP